MAQEPTPSVGWLQAQFPSIGTLINNVAVECGLNSSPAPLSSTDPNFVQMLVLANKLGKQLMRRAEWQLLNRTYTFTTNSSGPPTPDVTFYPLPNDFNRMINQTAWNRTSRLPMAGPLTAQGWEWLVGLVSNQFTIYLGFRQWGGTFAVYPSPNPADQTIAFEYQSNAWVQPVGTTTLDQRAQVLTAAGDIPIFDELMFQCGLKAAFLAAKGFDSTAAAAEFDAAVDNAVGSDAGAPKLNMSDNGFGMRYLDALNNVPPSGFGMP
jgi:hypothetical protein